MYNKLTQILLGALKTVKGLRLKVKSLNFSRRDPFGTPFSFKLLAISLFIGLQLITGMGAVHAGTLINNTAGIDWVDAWNQQYTTAKDTAAIYVLTPPTFVVQKDVRNLRTDETNSDVVIAVPDDDVEFSITITNTGETEARRISITDTVPFKTTYEIGSATDTSSFDPLNPPDTITFQHIAGGLFDSNDSGNITMIKWEWDRIDGAYGNNIRTVKFRTKVLK